MNNKQKKGLYQNLHQLFEQGITVNHISEELQFVSADNDAIETKKMLNENDFDTIGIANHGRITGYVKEKELEDGKCSDYLHRFDTEELVADSTPLINLLSLFKDKERVFILERNNISKIVVLADLQKPPVRMLIFGMITLLESYMKSIIVERYTKSGWRTSLTNERLKKAEDVYIDKRQNNEALDLLDCLQITDKFNIVRKDEMLRQVLAFESSKQAKSCFNKIEKLRNTLAHAHDLGMNLSWDDTLEIIEKMENLLESCEKSLNSKKIQ